MWSRLVQRGQMILNSQEEIVEALLNPRIYPASWQVKEVTVRQSHIAKVFLAGDYAFKLKRSVISPELDFSTPQKRRIACVHEMRRDTVYAPRLAVGVKSVRKLPNGRITIGGKAGVEIDTLLVMRRLKDENMVLSQIGDSEKFDRFDVMDLAEQLADLHCKAKLFRTKWSLDDIQKVIVENESVLSCFCPKILNRDKVRMLTRHSLSLLAQNARLVSLRQKSGRVRKCHGDLLLSNIAREGDKFMFFSPIEYNDALDCIDTLYDLSYLLMDFEVHGLRRLGNMLFNHYLAYTNDMSGYPLLPLYQSMRAATRAGVCAKTAGLLTGREKSDAIGNARQYFKLACDFLIGNQPVLIACGGLSGSGKSRIAREIGGCLKPSPGAVILRDDVVKKQMLGCALDKHMDITLDSPASEKVVYDVLRQQTRVALASGSCVIVDALFYDESERKAIEKLAAELKVPFVGLWVDAPLEVRTERVMKRKRNPSDVRDKAELERQLCLETGPITWNQINSDQDRKQTIQTALDILCKNGAPVYA